MHSLKVSAFILFFLFGFPMLAPARAVSPDMVNMVISKAAVAMEKLKSNIQAGRDVSKIIPRMKKVEKLANQKKLAEANRLLDEILHDFKVIDPSGESETPALFINPRKVNVTGYNQSVMEPFVTGDGKYLFFNNNTGDTPDTDKNIYYAKRIDDLNFKFMGAITGINSAEVDGVPTMDRNGNFYYISTVNYTKQNSFATVYSGKFSNGHVRNVKSHPELSLDIPGWVNMDIEISADGKTLYATQTFFDDNNQPKHSYFIVARLTGEKFAIDSRSNKIFHNINTGNLEYGASVSQNELEFYFTRVSLANGGKFTSYYATRPDRNSAFSLPKPIRAITGYAEAPAITSDGRLLYFHKKDGNRFALYVLERTQN